MNRRIRKKKDKKITEAINGLVSIAERREQQRQAAIRQFVKRCEALYEQQRKERRNWRSNKEKDNLHDTRPYKNSYRPHWQLNTAARQTLTQRGDLWPRQFENWPPFFIPFYGASRICGRKEFYGIFQQRNRRITDFGYRSWSRTWHLGRYQSLRGIWKRQSGRKCSYTVKKQQHKLRTAYPTILYQSGAVTRKCCCSIFMPLK